MKDTPTDLFACALDWHRAGRAVAIATVVATWGSAPRRVGSVLIVDAHGAMEGSVSGGCVEGAVVAEAMDALGDGKSRLLEFGVSDDDAFAVGLACGGQIKVLVEPVGGSMPVSLLEQLVAARAARVPVGYVADLAGDARHMIGPDDAADRFRNDQSGIAADGRTFIAIHNPGLRMIVVGAVHIAQTFVPMAQACGYDVVVVDPRDSFAAPDRFGKVRLMADWPDDALAALVPDSRTAIVTLTHDPKLDDPAICAALRSEVFYLGCLGSTRTHAKRVARLAEAGFDEKALARIHAPVGLDIGGATPAEIAVSIIAQITQVLRQRA